MADDAGRRPPGADSVVMQNTDTETAIRSRLKEGSLKLYELEKEVPAVDAIRIRREFVESETGIKLDNVGIFSIDVERVVKRNCENMIGTVQVPVGVAGPLLVNGEYAHGSYYLPLATTEGALVASVNRGCNGITRSGGAEVRILHDGMTRAPSLRHGVLRTRSRRLTGLQGMKQSSGLQRKAQQRTENSSGSCRSLPARASFSVWTSIPRTRWV
jgi:hydroxymethylglutaryl-CoA reductase (NADPH)